MISVPFIDHSVNGVLNGGQLLSLSSAPALHDSLGAVAHDLHQIRNVPGVHALEGAEVFRQRPQLALYYFLHWVTHQALCHVGHQMVRAHWSSRRCSRGLRRLQF